MEKKEIGEGLKKMAIKISISEDCPACGTKNSMAATVVVDDRHVTRAVHCRYSAIGWEPFKSPCVDHYVWKHDGFSGNGLIHLTCHECGAHGILEMGSIYYSCTGQGSNDPCVGPWCDGVFGECTEK